MVPVQHMPTSSLRRQRVLELCSFLAPAAYSPPAGVTTLLVGRAVAEPLPAQRGQAGQDLLVQRLCGQRSSRECSRAQPSRGGSEPQALRVWAALARARLAGACVWNKRGVCR